jgi:tRNA/tmRNA/rRNA uracil-C5-methylase (TrmA/RlmC/RlmD family)
MNFKNTYDNSCVLINIGKIGIGKNICEQLLTHNHKVLLIISCHEKSFNRDYEILKKKYEIVNVFIFTTSYNVILYVLKKII